MNNAENKLNILTDAEMKGIETALDTVASLLPSISLRDGEKQNLTVLDPYKKTFIKEALIQMDFGSHIVPGYISKDNIQNNINLFEQIEKIEAQLRSVLRRATDSKLLTGNNAYLAAISVLRAFEIANTAGVMNAKEPYVKLKKRFDSQSNAVLYKPKQP